MFKKKKKQRNGEHQLQNRVISVGGLGERLHLESCTEVFTGVSVLPSWFPPNTPGQQRKDIIKPH